MHSSPKRCPHAQPNPHPLPRNALPDAFDQLPDEIFLTGQEPLQEEGGILSIGAQPLQVRIQEELLGQLSPSYKISPVAIGSVSTQGGEQNIHTLIISHDYFCKRILTIMKNII